MMHEVQVGRIVQTLPFSQQAVFHQQILDALVTFFGEKDLFVLLFQRVITWPILGFLWFQEGNEGVYLGVEVRAFVDRPGNDQRRARLVDQNGVDLVHDCETAQTLHPVLGSERHVVAQVIETKLVVRTVGDIRLIGGALLIRRLAGYHHSGRHAEKIVDFAHPGRVAPRQIVVHGHHIYTSTGKSVQIGRQRSYQGLALAGAHFGDPSLVKHHAADQLHVEMTHTQHPL